MEDTSNYALNGKIMLCSVIILFVAILLILCFQSRARALLRGRRHRRQNWTHHRLSLTTATSPSAVSPGGLDVSVIKSIPTFIYATGRQQRLECAVCLSEFEHEDCARVLPKCNHAFHVDCIDMWFNSHSNCPLCRAPVEKIIPDIPQQLPEQAAVAAVTEPAGLEENVVNCSSLRPECRIKTLELVGIVVEMPTGKERLGALQDAGSGGASPRGDGMKSPSHRILSLRRVGSI